MTKQKLIVMDIDGVFADSYAWQLKYFTNGKMDEEGYHENIADFPVNEWLLRLVNSYVFGGRHILFLSGRPLRYLRETIDWFSSNEKLTMFDVKSEHNCTLVLEPNISQSHSAWKVSVLKVLETKYDIEICFDDSPHNIKAFRKAGYKAVQMENLY